MRAVLRSLRAPLRLWRWLWNRAPRQIVVTREGKILIGIALGAGFAAINTGNNLLFLSWGMVLTAIIVSGLLSEQTLRVLEVRCKAPEEARAGQPVPLPVVLHNTALRTAALGVSVDLQISGPKNPALAEPLYNLPAPFTLRLGPGESHELFARFVPAGRGLHRLLRLRASTTYPFGFFEKSRPFRPAREIRFWVAPARVDVSQLSLELFAALGEEPARRPGSGTEFFSLRPYRTGDDPRRIQWRRSAKANRWVVVETEALAARQVRLVLSLGGVEPRLAEHGLAVLGSLSEDLLARGFAVGVEAPGLLLAPGRGARQRWEILHGLAQVDIQAAMPVAPDTPGLSRIALQLPGAASLAGVDAVVQLGGGPDASEVAA